MPNPLFERQLRRRRGLSGHYVPGYGNAVNSQLLPGQTDAPQFPNGGPVSQIRPQQQLTDGPLGRNLTSEEALGHWILRRHKTVDGGNQLERGGIKRPLEVMRKPWLDLTPGGEAYINLNPQQIVIGAVGSVTVVVSFQVPRRKNGTIEWIANQVIGGQNIEGTGLVKWQILLDGVPAFHYDNIPATIGTMSNPADLRESPIRIFENQLVQLVLVNIAFNPNQQILLGMLRGKFYPVEQEGPNTWV